MGYLRCLTPTTVLASLLIGPLAKAESPQLLPTRDMDITYDVTLPSQPRVRERVRWLAAEQLERVDGPRCASIRVGEGDFPRAGGAKARNHGSSCSVRGWRRSGCKQCKRK